MMPTHCKVLTLTAIDVSNCYVIGDPYIAKFKLRLVKPNSTNDREKGDSLSNANMRTSIISCNKITIVFETLHKNNTNFSFK